jgi:ribonuclease HI
VHDKGDATIEQSAKFLLSYVKNLNSNEFVDAAADGDTVLIPHTDQKGKKPIQNLETAASNSTAHQNRTNQIPWEPPPDGCLKTNVDGSFVAETGTTAVGAIIRDHQGETVAVAGKILTNCQNAEEAEAMALMEGARLAANWTRKPMIFESDCKQIVNEFVAEKTLSRWRGTMHDFSMYASAQPTWRCSLVKRSQNWAAHEIATYVRKMGIDCAWNSCFPVTVEKAIALDCNRYSIINE